MSWQTASWFIGIGIFLYEVGMAVGFSEAWDYFNKDLPLYQQQEFPRLEYLFPCLILGFLWPVFLAKRLIKGQPVINRQLRFRTR